MSELFSNLLQEDKLLHKDLSYRLVGMAMKVHRELGRGFLERVYENAMAILLRKENISFQQQFPLKVYFEGETVGDYFADMIVEEKIIIEFKSAENLSPAHNAQAVNYLRATGLELAIIINFGRDSLQYERVVNYRKS